MFQPARIDLPEPAGNAAHQVQGHLRTEDQQLFQFRSSDDAEAGGFRRGHAGGSRPAVHDNHFAKEIARAHCLRRKFSILWCPVTDQHGTLFDEIHGIASRTGLTNDLILLEINGRSNPGRNQLLFRCQAGKQLIHTEAGHNKLFYTAPAGGQVLHIPAVHICTLSPKVGCDPDQEMQVGRRARRPVLGRLSPPARLTICAPPAYSCRYGC